MAERPMPATQPSSLQAEVATWLAAVPGQAVWMERTESQAGAEAQRLAV